ncbi:ComEA family DNA-binding protein [Thalassolituus sp. LLYu03]|uniref:ComEA family DNA-binding protein n=1 Tax=Thalassolituus sp. LLYu03 TaxID=3421656 RepID=UPI003D2CE029
MQWIKHFLSALLISLSLTAFAEEPTPQTVNLNTATVEQLTTLKGVGKAKAEAIIQYRAAHGEFKSLDELTQVKGIGAGIIEKNRGLLALE